MSASKGVAQTPFQQIECTWVHFDDAGASLVHSLAFSPVTLESDRHTADRWINGAALELISSQKPCALQFVLLIG